MSGQPAASALAAKYLRHVPRLAGTGPPSATPPIVAVGPPHVSYGQTNPPYGGVVPLPYGRATYGPQAQYEPADVLAWLVQYMARRKVRLPPRPPFMSPLALHSDARTPYAAV